MGSVVISGATSGAVTLAVPDEAGTRTLTLPATTGTILTNDISQAGDTSAGNAAAVGYTSAEGLILTGQGSTSDVTIKNDADATVLSIPTGSGNVGIGTTAASTYANSMGNTLVVGTGNNFAVIQGRTDGASGSTNGVNYGGSYGTNPINGARMLIGAAGGAGQRGLVTFNTKNTDDNTNQPSEKMRIGADGNVGIGTSSPTGKLTVSSDIKVLGSNFANVEFTGASVNGSGVYTGLDSGGGYVVNVRDSGLIGFSTSNAERMRIRANGQVLINQTSIIASDNAYLQVTGGSVTPVALRGGTNNYFMAFYKQSNNDLIGSITGSSGTATAFNTSSDYRLKENIDYTWDATTRLKQLKPARFNFISDDTNTLVDGFIAHEVQEVVPHAVTGEKDAVDDDGKPIYQGIDQSKLVPLLTASLQEALKRIDSLEEQVNALKGK